jgi:bisphosphoglycerate-dependent phosphoglycerate mutase
MRRHRISCDTSNNLNPAEYLAPKHKPRNPQPSKLSKRTQAEQAHPLKKTAKRHLPLFRTNIADNTTAENQHVTLVLHEFELATPAEIQVELS